MDDLEFDKQALRIIFDNLSDISKIDFKTDKGKEIQQGLNDAWKIIKPYIITLAKEL